MKYLKYFENTEYSYRKILSEMLVDLVTDGLSITVHDCYNDHHDVSVVVIKEKLDGSERGYSLEHFDMEIYYNDFSQLISYMERDGYSSEVKLFSYINNYDVIYKRDRRLEELIKINSGKKSFPIKYPVDTRHNYGIIFNFKL